MDNQNYPTGADGESAPWKDDSNYEECVKCDGSGFDSDEFETCTACNGTGQMEITQDDIDDRAGEFDERI